MLSSIATKPLEPEFYAKPLVSSTQQSRSVYMCAITFLGALTGAYAMKDRNITVGFIGGGFLATAIALSYLNKDFQANTPDDVKKYETAQTGNEKDIESLKESEQKQTALVNEIGSNLNFAIINARKAGEKIKQVHRDMQESLSSLSNINKVMDKWEKHL
ncbi:MAG: hypothetical protein K2Y01_05655 [Rhabdochlamydiaceae bacterium]|nr:hypothetical protein [Rhabdochlamydiaceae bacterium]